MNIVDILDRRAVKASLSAKAKPEVLRELLDALVASGGVEGEPSEVLEGLLAREELGSTGIGYGVAIPHCKSESVSRLVAACGRSAEGVAFDALDGKPAHIFFMLVGPKGSAGAHLKALARMSRLLKDASFRGVLAEADTDEALYAAIQSADAAA